MMLIAGLSMHRYQTKEFEKKIKVITLNKKSYSRTQNRIVVVSE